MTYLTPLTPEQRHDVDDLIKYTQANRRPLRKPRVRKREPGLTPRPANCFLIYRKEKQAQIAEICPRANHRVISKIVAKWWKDIDESTRQVYVNVAKQVKQDHLLKFPNYKYTPKRKPKTSPEKHHFEQEDEIRKSPVDSTLLTLPVMDHRFDPYLQPSCLFQPTMTPLVDYLDPQWTTLIQDTYLYQPQLAWMDFSTLDSESPSSVLSEQYDLYPPLA